MMVSIYCMPWNKKNGTEEFVAKAFEQLLWRVQKNTITEAYPDLILILGRRTVNPKIVRQWRETYPDTKYIAWIWDPIAELDLVNMSVAVDHTFVSQEPLIEHLERASILHQAHDPDIHHFMDIKKKYKYGFIGTYSPYREEKLKAYEDVKIWGNGWPLDKYGIVKPVYNEEFSKAVNQCEEIINIPITKFYETRVPYISSRKWMVQACQGKKTPTYKDRIIEMLNYLKMPTDGRIRGLYENNKKEVQKEL